MKKENKWIHAVIPAILCHLAIGSVYCWSLFAQEIANALSISRFSADMAFSLAIFFLGMSAAFMGKIVEKHPKLTMFISMFCFVSGLLGTSLAITMNSLLILYLSYGVLMGCGCGIGYISPIKTLMLWFKDHKGLASGIAIMSFGAAKAIASPTIVYLMKTYSLSNVFLIMGSIYFILMLIASILLKKYPYEIEKSEISDIKISNMLKTKEYISIWIMFFLNISCGLALIAKEKTLALGLGIKEIGILLSITAIFNALGRIGYSGLSDKTFRKLPYYCIFSISVIAALMFNIHLAIPFIIALCIVNLNYGGGFSALPSLLGKIYGMNNASTIHGLTLSGWAFAGFCGPLMANLIPQNYLYYVLAGLYLFSLVIIKTQVRKV